MKNELKALEEICAIYNENDDWTIEMSEQIDKITVENGMKVSDACWDLVEGETHKVTLNERKGKLVAEVVPIH